MKVCYQPTLANPGDRVEIDSADRAGTPKRPRPVGTLDRVLLWAFAAIYFLALALLIADKLPV
jgi:hypothetical protein